MSEKLAAIAVNILIVVMTVVFSAVMLSMAVTMIVATYLWRSQ